MLYFQLSSWCLEMRYSVFDILLQSEQFFQNCRAQSLQFSYYKNVMLINSVEKKHLKPDLVLIKKNYLIVNLFRLACAMQHTLGD